MKSNKFLLSLLAIIVLSGCNSSTQRMADCQAQGISRDACYIAEQNRKASILAAVSKQAMENAQAHYPVQHAQWAHRLPEVWTGFGTIVEKRADSLVYVDGKPATLEETEDTAKVYQQGLYQVIFYRNGKVQLMKNNVYAGELQPTKRKPE